METAAYAGKIKSGGISVKLSYIDSDNTVADFKWEDGFVLINNKYFARTRVENSPLVSKYTIVRYFEDLDAYEGDVLINKETGEVLGRLIYCAGFCLQELNGFIKNLPDFRHIKIRRGRYEDRAVVTRTKSRTPLQFCVNGKMFKLTALLDYKNGHVILQNEGGRFFYDKVLPSEIRLMTGIHNTCLGDFYQGGYIVMREGKIMLERDNCYEKLN